MSEPGNPADLPGYDAAGEEWYASGAPEPVRFETAASPRPASTGIRVFVGVVLGILALGVIALIVAMVATVGT